MSNTLIIYFSHKGENYFGGSIRSIDKGNTEYVAEYIGDITGGDLFEIRTEKKYPNDYYNCCDEAKSELNGNVRPGLEEYLDTIDPYDNIFICGPCWWGTYPMAVFTQLEKLDWSGKNVYAVMTHEGSGMGNSISDLRKTCKGSAIKGSIAINGSSAKGSKTKISDWIFENVYH